jgi:hypothetical protein
MPGVNSWLGIRLELKRTAPIIPASVKGFWARIRAQLARLWPKQSQPRTP